MDTKKLCKLIEERREELFDMLISLININSENLPDTGNEKECAEYIHNLCLEMGLSSDIYSPLSLDGFEKHPDYFHGKDLGNRYNVVAKYFGEEDNDELMLMSHIDTVRAGDMKNWETNPFEGVIRDGKIIGRGACDDKYALAATLFILKLLQENRFTPKRNLLFAAYCDEEYGGSHGAMAAVMKYPCPKIVSMDGRENQLWHCGSGGGEMKYIFRTKEAVDSAKKVYEAIPTVIEIIEKFADARRKELSENRFYTGTIIPQTALRYMGIRAGYDGSDLGTGEVFFVFYTDKTRDEIYAELAELETELAARLEPLGIIGEGFKPQTRFFHYVFCEPTSPDIELMLEASREATGREPIVCGACLSDMSVISKYGSSNAFAFGAGRDFSKPGGAHQPNEYIECDKLVDYTKTIATYILKVLG